MILSVIINSALKSLRTNVMRTSLTMLGIIIGIGAVISISSIGKGAVAFITDELSSFGTNFFQVAPGTAMMSTLVGGGKKPLTPKDVEAIENAGISNISIIAPFSFTSRVASANGESETVLVYGMTKEAAELLKPEMVYGEFFSDFDNGTRVSVIGIDLAEKLFGADTNPIGETIKIEDLRFKVIGVSKAGGNFMGRYFDTAVSVPLDVMHGQISGDDSLTEIGIGVHNSDLINETIDEVEMTLQDFRNIGEEDDNDFFITSFAETLEIATSITNLLTVLIAGISAISLVVGGVGVMNIMLVSVTERTKEIGLLKAIGAKRKDILTQFLAESVVMTSIGGVLGIILGIIGAFLISKAVEIPFVISPLWVAVAVGISSVVGVLFGVYPAVKASELSPIDALRYE